MASRMNPEQQNGNLTALRPYYNVIGKGMGGFVVAIGWLSVGYRLAIGWLWVVWSGFPVRSPPQTHKKPESIYHILSLSGWSPTGLVPPWTYPIPIDPPPNVIFDQVNLSNRVSSHTLRSRSSSQICRPCYLT